jgi:hypothetical protein
MMALILPLRNVRLQHVAGLISHETFAPRSGVFGKAVLIGRTYLTRPMPGRFDPQRLNVGGAELLRSILADTGRVNPMRLR